MLGASGLLGRTRFMSVTTSSPHPSLRPETRPRERMMVHGSTGLGEAELVALLLGGGHAVARATVLLRRFAGLTALSTALPQELVQVPGIGMASATALCAAFELGRRAARAGLPYATAVRGPDDVQHYLQTHLGDEPQEVFLVIGLDARQRVRLVRTVAVGSLAHVDVHPREVFRPLTRAGMHSVIAVHNHPSGDPQPSEADIRLTQRLATAGELMGIPLLDHLVVTRTATVSLAALGLLDG